MNANDGNASTCDGSKKHTTYKIDTNAGMDVISETPELIISILKRIEYIFNAWVDVVLAASHNFQTIHIFYFIQFFLLVYYCYYCYGNFIIGIDSSCLIKSKKSPVQTPNGQFNSVIVNWRKTLDLNHNLMENAF